MYVYHFIVTIYKKKFNITFQRKLLYRLIADLSIKTVLSFFHGIQIIATIINFLFSIFEYLLPSTIQRIDFELNFM